MTEKGSEVGRYQFKHEGRTVYEWEQSLEDVNLYIRSPAGMTKDMVECTITPNHLKLGISGNPPFLDEATGGPVVRAESYWMLRDGEINIVFQKMRKGETWESALRGRGGAAVDPLTRQEIQKELMLERFQEENPGFDFRGAEFNGAVPDPRGFMGGIKYT
ncbi:HSP20-like chaperone [Pelagophyceae sp. CCMP2097]|nr:HSP20-like chaperone [Pelagophyceae sp. CCMP2097]